MRLDSALNTLRKSQPGRYTIEISRAWGQGRTLFGGIQVAAMVHALRDALGETIVLRSLQAVFVGPVAPGRVDISVEILRTGKSTVHAQARMTTGDEVGCLVMAVFGKARQSAINVAIPRREPALPAADARTKPFVKGQSPDFARLVEQSWAAGDFPYTASQNPHIQVHVHYPEETRVTEALVIAMADTIPSPAYSMLDSFAPASSMTWTLEFLHQDFAALATRGWWMDARVTSAADGYVYQDGTLFAPDGQAVALSRQSVVVFA